MANFYSLLGDTEIDTSKAEASLDRLQRRIRQTGQAGAQAGQNASQSFGELNSIFGGLLPRNMQSIVRRFQSTSRAVRRAGRSMSFFKKTLVSLGLPALIIVIGELIANWEKFTDLLGITSEETRQLKKDQEALNRTIIAATSAIEPYLEVVTDLNRELKDRKVAQDQLSQTVRAAAGIDLEAEDAVVRLTAATANYVAQQETQKQLALVQEKINKKREEQAAAELSWVSMGYSAQGKANAEAKLRAELEKEIQPLEKERNEIIKRQIELQNDLNEELERQREEKEAEAQAARDAAEALREQERLAQKAAQAREQREKRETEAVERRILQDEQVSMSAQQLFLDNLRRSEEEELALVESEEAKFAIIAFYEEKRRVYFEDKYNQEQADLAAKAEKEEQDLARRTESAQKAIDTAEEKAFQERNTADMSAREIALMENEQQYNALLDQANQFGLDTTQLEEDRRLKENAINDKYNAEDLESAKKNQEAITAAKTRAVGEGARLVSQMGRLAEEGTNASKGFAITEVLLNQAIAMSEAVKGASKASAAGGPAAPFLMAGYMLSMVGGVVSSFSAIKGILDDADAGGGSGAVGSGGGAGRQMSSPLVPEQNFDVENNAAQNVNVSAFVVQSQLQGSQLDQASAMARATL